MKFGSVKDRQGAMAYIALVAVLTLPFYLAGALASARLMPGLSVSAFSVIVPATSATIVVAMSGGRAGIRSLFADLRQCPGPHAMLIALAAVSIPVIASLASWSVPSRDEIVPLLFRVASLAPIFLIAAAAEEIGWTAFLTKRVSAPLGATVCGVLVGATSALWHVPALVGLERSADWIAWWFVWAVAQRIVMVRLYLFGGFWIWGPILFHTASNIAWQAAPDGFDPLAEAIAMAGIAAIAVLACHFARYTRATRP